MTPSKEDPYFIEVDTIGCTQCGHGKNWNIIGPDGAALGTSYTDEDDAAEMAEMLNEAFGSGATDRDRLAERVKELEEKITAILQVDNQSRCGGADGLWPYRYSLAIHEAEKLLGWPTTKPDEPTPEQEKGFSDLFAEAAKERAEQLALVQRLAGMEQRIRELENDSCK